MRGSFVHCVVALGVGLLVAACATQKVDAKIAAAPSCEWLDATFTPFGGTEGAPQIVHVGDGAADWVRLVPGEPANRDAARFEIAAATYTGALVEIRVRSDDVWAGGEGAFVWYGVVSPVDTLPQSFPVEIYHPEAQGPWPELDRPGLNKMVGYVSLTCHETRSPGQATDWNSFAI